MNKKTVIPESVTERIKSMYVQGYSVQTICDVTERTTKVVKEILIDAGIFGPMRGIVLAPGKRGKYDDLFEEKMCQGKMYSQYAK